MKQFRLVFGVGAGLALLACLVSAVLYFTGTSSEADFKSAFLGASIAWFVCGWLWTRGKGQPSSAPY